MVKNVQDFVEHKSLFLLDSVVSNEDLECTVYCLNKNKGSPAVPWILNVVISEPDSTQQ